MLNKNIDHLLQRLSALIAGSTNLLVLSLVYEGSSLMINLDQTCLSTMLACIVALEEQYWKLNCLPSRKYLFHFALVI